jgi:hypothetical protein
VTDRNLARITQRREALSSSASDRFIPAHPLPVSSSVSSAFPYRSMSRLVAFTRNHDFSRSAFPGLQTFLYVQGLRVCSPPRSFLPLRILHGAAAEVSKSGPILLRCLRTHRIPRPGRCSRSSSHRSSCRLDGGIVVHDLDNWLSFVKTPHHSEFRPRNNVTSLSACLSFQTHFEFWRRTAL